MDHTRAIQTPFIIFFLFLSHYLGGRCLKLSVAVLGTRTHLDWGKLRRKRCGNVERKWAWESRAPSFFFLSVSPFLFSRAWNICQHSDSGGEEERAEGLVCSGPGPGISGAAQLGTAGLFICPDLAFAPRLRDLLSERSHCPAGKICYKYLPWGECKAMARSQPDSSCKIHYSAFLN